MATSTRLTDSDTCPRCFGSLQTDPRETWCTECGLVTDENPIDHGPDWSRAPEGETHERAKPGNRNLPGRGLGSDTDHDPAKPWLNPGDKTERTRTYATTEIHRMGMALDLPRPVIDRAKYLFRKLHADGGVPGTNADAIAAGCLFAACREDRQGRVAAEVAEVARCEERPLRRRCRDVADTLGVLLPPPDPQQRLRVVAGKLGLSGDVVAEACARLDEVDANGAPSTVVAVVLYQVSTCTQQEVADAAKCTPAGLRACRDRLN